MSIEWFDRTQAAAVDLLPILRALSDPTRFAVFQCIRECGGAAGYDITTGQCDGASEAGVALCEIRCQMPCSASTLTHHLNVLRDAGLIETERKGRMVYTRICPEALDRLRIYFSSGIK